MADQPQSPTSINLVGLPSGEVTTLTQKEAAAQAETNPTGPKHKELELYVQGLKAKYPGTATSIAEAQVEVAASDSSLDLIPFPFVSSTDIQALSGKVRVFIMGVEVSAYVDSANWSGNAATSDLNCTASVHLKCPHDLLTITQKNLDTAIPADQVNWVISSDPMYSEQVKRDVYEYKRKQNYFERTTNVPRWNLAPNTCIFHHADTIRIFVQLPWTQKDAWLPVFTGYLQSPQVSRQTTGQDDISMTCDTLASRLAKARVFNQMNAELLNPKSGTSRLPNNQEFTGITNIDIVDTSLLFADAFGPAANALLDTSLTGLLRFVFYGDLSQSNKLFKQQDQQALEAALSEYFNKKDALTALKGKGAALGLSYTEEIDKLTKDMEAAKSKVLQLPGGKNTLDDKGNIQDSTYVKSSLRGRRALGFLDPQLFVTDWAFPVSGTIVPAVTQPDVPKSSTSTQESNSTTYSKQLPVNIDLQKSGITTGYGDVDASHSKPHEAIDLPVKNQPVMAPIDGWVLSVNYDATAGNGAGRYVRFMGVDGYVHDLFHLSSVSSVKFGQKCSKGAQLGISGNTGRSVGAGGGYHLHWGVWKWNDATPDWTGKPVKVARANGSAVNPLWWLGSDAVLDAANRKPQTKSVMPPDIDQSSIDWKVEVAMFEQWKKNCLVGWANGVPDPKFKTDITDASTFDNTLCLSLARDRNRTYLTYDEVTIIGRNSGFLGQYSPHGQNVAIVLRAPRQGWGYNYGATEDFQIQGASFEVNTQTRAQILIELLSKVDYYWWVSGNGDIVFDFPNYEVLPDHYGEKFRSEYEFYGLGVNDTLTEDVASLKSTYIFRGGIGGPMSARAGQMEMLSRIYPAIFKIPSVAARNGIEVEEAFWPYITSQEQLKVLGALQIRKAIANAFKYTVAGLPPLLYVTPNTAVYLGDIDAYALVHQVTFGYSANGHISCELDFTAIRQKLTPEQLYLKLQPSAGSEVKADAMNSFLTAWNLQAESAKNNGDVVKTKLQRTAALYGYIFGTGELLIDYTKTYSQNIKATDKWTVQTTDDKGAYVTGQQGNATVFKDTPGVQRLISTPIKDGANLTVPPSTTNLFDTPVEATEDQKAALAQSFEDLEPNTITPAILAHGNVTTGLQDRWTLPDFSSVTDLLSNGVGFLNLSSKILGQIDNTVSGFAQIGSRVGLIAGASFDAVASLQAAGKSLQQVTARSRVIDPRMDPYFSGLCAAAIAKQTLAVVNKTQTRPLSAAEVNPDIFAYSLQLGPRDPALLAFLAENDIKDTSDAACARMGRNLQNSLWKLGGYTKKDLDYVDALQNMKKQAAKRGLHS